MSNRHEITNIIVVAALAGVMGATVGVMTAQAQRRGRGAGAMLPSVSQRKGQIGATALNFLGTKPAFSDSAFGPISFSEAAEKADALGTGYLEASSTQKVSPGDPKNLDYNLSPADVTAVKNRLEELRMKLVAYRAPMPADDSARRQLFTFAKAIGAEAIVTNTAPAALAGLDSLAREFDINVAFETSNEKALDGLSNHIGLYVNAPTAAGLKAVNERLLGFNLASAPGTEQILLELTKLNPTPPPPPVTCGDCGYPKVPLRPVFVTIAATPAAVKAYEQAARPAEGYQIIQISKMTPISSGHYDLPSPAMAATLPARVLDRWIFTGPPCCDEHALTEGGIPPLDRWMITESTPKHAVATPKKARKVLVLDLCPQGGFYHRSVPYANLAIELMAKNTGAFTAVFDNDLDNLKYPKIKEYDAVILNSLVGDVFTDKEVMAGLLRFVREGGGLLGIHGTTFASGDVPEFGLLMGATSGPHKIEPAMLKVNDPGSPITSMFQGQDFQWVDELYHFPASGPYSPDRLHVLVSIDIPRSGPPPAGMANRPNNDYGLVWIRNEGKGRVFNCALGHTVMLFGTPETAQMMLNGIQYVLGDLDADATPTSKLAGK